MALNINPNIKNDGLVFYFDMENIKSYPGEPTENLFSSNITFQNGIGSYSPISGTITAISDTENYYKNCKIIKHIINDIASTTDINHYWGFHASTTLAYSIKNIQMTLSVWCKEREGKYGQMLCNSGAWTSGHTALKTFQFTGNWQRESLTFTLTGDNVSASISVRFSTVGNTAWNDTSNIGEVAYWTAAQIEQKSHVTPFVNGTRSSLQSLKDISKKKY